jgi:uncharacterized membrane protein YjjP (DUF1212 family)
MRSTWPRGSVSSCCAVVQVLRRSSGSVAAVAASAGVDVIEVDITLQSLLVQASSSSGRPHTLLRVVRRTRHDYARLAAVHELVEGLADGTIDSRDADRRLREIKRTPRRFSVLAVSVASAVLASSVAVMIGASPAPPSSRCSSCSP